MIDSKAPEIVGVIFSQIDFQRAIRMRNPPGLFELRLDGLVRGLDVIEKAIQNLPAPLVVTARHPKEGGVNDLSSRQRERLLLKFLAHANYIDVELRSAGALMAVCDAAREHGVGIIGSFHDFTGTPDAERLDESAALAQSLGVDIFKIATRTNTPAELERLLGFFEHQRRTTVISAMGIGKLGRISRLEFARRGCPLNYAHLGTSRVPGQVSVGELRRALP